LQGLSKNLSVQHPSGKLDWPALCAGCAAPFYQKLAPLVHSVSLPFFAFGEEGEEGEEFAFVSGKG
jgi:hypothetical protein